MSLILVVDDDATTRVVMRMVLEKAGYEVVEAAHGEAALRLIRPDPLPDVVVTDLSMPILSGEELIGRLRSEPRTVSIPIVVVSGDGDGARSLKASGAVEAVVSKPFDAVALAECIRRVSGNASRSALTV